MPIPASKLSLVILVIITATTRPPITGATTTVPTIRITPTPVNDSPTTQPPETNVSTADTFSTVIQSSVTAAATQFLATDTVTAPHLAVPTPVTAAATQFLATDTVTAPHLAVPTPSPTTLPSATVIITTQPPITTTQPSTATNRSTTTQLASSSIITRTTGVSSTHLFTTDSSGFGGVSKPLYLGLGFGLLLIAIIIACICFCIICYAKSDHGKKKDPEKSVHWSANEGYGPLNTADKESNFASTSELTDPTEVEKKEVADVTLATFGFSEGPTKPSTPANNLDGQEQEVKKIEFKEQDGMVLSDLPESTVVVP